MQSKRMNRLLRSIPAFIVGAGPLYILQFSILLFTSFGCASPVAPEGGPRDERPPHLITGESTPNLQTNFEKQPIELTFDEWVVVEDVFNQVVISPPLEFRPEVRLRRRTVIFEFDEREELRPEATYTINFGEAVKDLTEKNPAEDLRFVFSTGDFIDSLNVEGRIVDARTGEPVENVLFMLYENLADTVVRTERPFYFARSGEDGTFRVSNVKSGTFKGFALEDADLNYRFNQPTERIGFPGEPIVVADTVDNFLEIRLFAEEQPLRLTDALSDRYGLVRLAFNQELRDLELDYPDRIPAVYFEYEKDSLRVYYDQPDDRPWNLILRQDTAFSDTVLIDPAGKAEFLENAALAASGRSSGTETFNPANPLRLRFNHPLRAVDTALVRLYEDTLRNRVAPTLQIDSADRRQLVVDFKWKEEQYYQLEMLPEALTDWYGLRNDTIVRDYRANLLKNYSTLTLLIEGMQPDTAYVFRLRSSKDPSVAEYRVRGETTLERTLRHVQPGEYVLTIITDLNGNGRWDPGNYDLGRQPEPIEDRELEQLRPNWEVESRVLIGTAPVERDTLTN